MATKELKAVRNRWALRIEVGNVVSYNLPRGGKETAQVARIINENGYPRIVMMTGASCTPDDVCSVALPTEKMKPFMHGKWHAWQGTNGVLLSDEDAKKLREFVDADTCINWLFLNDEKPAARALNIHMKGE